MDKNTFKPTPITTLKHHSQERYCLDLGLK